MTRSDARITEKEMCRRARRAAAIAVEELGDVRSRDSRAVALNDRVRSGTAVEDAALDICLHGVTVSRARGLAESLSGARVGTDVVDRIAWRLMAEAAGRRTHALSMSYPCLYMTVTTTKERRQGRLVDTPLLVAIGMNDKGYREALAVEAAAGATAEECRSLLRGLVGRGLRGVQRVVGDYHAGVDEAVRAELPYTTPEWRASIRDGAVMGSPAVGAASAQGGAVNVASAG